MIERVGYHRRACVAGCQVTLLACVVLAPCVLRGAGDSAVVIDQRMHHLRTSTGSARIGVPAGRYTIYAGRGFEYSLDSTEVTLAAGETLRRRLSIRREVPTECYVACDTHVHTLTHSGHGDASVQERMITLAAEGIELPIATDHNVHIDHRLFDWEPRIIGCSGAVWLDVDGDGRRTAAYDYAQRLFAESRGDLEKLIDQLSDYDRAVAAQVAYLYQASGKSWFTPSAQAALHRGTEETQAGVRMYLEAWRENQTSRSQN